VLELVLLAVWGGLDKRLSGRLRLMLLLVPVAYVVCWLGLAEWAKAGAQVYVGVERLKQDDVSSSRFAIWSNAIELIKMQPWLGTGFGQFNVAWTLTPFPHRPTEFFDHPHNLVLHLMAELGVPLGLLVTLLLCWALWQAFAASRLGDASLQGMTRAAFMMVVTIAAHSQLEYPLWYAYFLLPAALVFGLALGATPPASAESTVAGSTPDRSVSPPASTAAQPHSQARTARSATMLMVCAALVLAGSIGSVFDYNRVVAIFAPPANAGPLMDRIDAGMHSVFFAHHAGYAMATTEQDPPAELSAFKSPEYYLLDDRLMSAWADAYARAGDRQKASYIARRIAEFHGDNSAYFAICHAAPAKPAAGPASGGSRVTASLPTSPPYQCQEPTEPLTWRDFR